MPARYCHPEDRAFVWGEGSLDSPAVASAMRIELGSFASTRVAKQDTGSLDFARMTVDGRSLCRLGGRHRYRRVLRPRPGIAHAVDYGDRAEDGDDPEHG